MVAVHDMTAAHSYKWASPAFKRGPAEGSVPTPARWGHPASDTSSSADAEPGDVRAILTAAVTEGHLGIAPTLAYGIISPKSETQSDVQFAATRGCNVLELENRLSAQATRAKNSTPVSSSRTFPQFFNDELPPAAANQQSDSGAAGFTDDGFELKDLLVAAASRGWDMAERKQVERKQGSCTSVCGGASARGGGKRQTDAEVDNFAGCNVGVNADVCGKKDWDRARRRCRREVVCRVRAGGLPAAVGKNSQTVARAGPAPPPAPPPAPLTAAGPGVLRVPWLSDRKSQVDAEQRAAEIPKNPRARRYIRDWHRLFDNIRDARRTVSLWVV